MEGGLAGKGIGIGRTRRDGKTEVVGVVSIAPCYNPAHGATSISSRSHE